MITAACIDTVATPEPLKVELNEKGGVKLYPNGTVEFYGDYEPTLLCQAYWEARARKYWA